MNKLHFVVSFTLFTLASTEPGMHTIRTALGSFFLYLYGNKPATSLVERI